MKLVKRFWDGQKFCTKNEPQIVNNVNTRNNSFQPKIKGAEEYLSSVKHFLIVRAVHTMWSRRQLLYNSSRSNQTGQTGQAQSHSTVNCAGLNEQSVSGGPIQPDWWTHHRAESLNQHSEDRIFLTDFSFPPTQMDDWMFTRCGDCYHAHLCRQSVSSVVGIIKAL